MLLRTVRRLTVGHGETGRPHRYDCLEGSSESTKPESGIEMKKAAFDM